MKYEEEIKYLKKYYNGDINIAIERLKKGEPVQYIVGNVDFYGNIIKVDKRVLIPRRETEELIEKTLKYIKRDNIKILDLCTGSGCIAITLKKMFPKSLVYASDISSDALSLASENAKLNNVYINFIQSDLFSNINNKYDLIISNPPYISYDEKIMDIVKNNEPSIALYADNNGLYYYEEILKKIKKYMNSNCVIAFEIGYNQGEKLKELSKKYLDKEEIILKDMQGFNRFCIIN